MLSFEDGRLHDVIEIATTIPVAGRDAFLRELAIELVGHMVGDGAVHLAAIRARRTVMRLLVPAPLVFGTNAKCRNVRFRAYHFPPPDL